MASKANVIVYVKNNDLESALKRFNEKCKKEKIFKKVSNHGKRDVKENHKLNRSVHL